MAELGADQVPQGIGGEIAKQPLGPVNVLEAAVAVAGRHQAQQGDHAAVPFGGQVGHRQIAFHQLQLQFVAQHDVEAIAEFIGLDPDQAGPQRIKAAPEILAAAPGLDASSGLEAGQPAIGEGTTAGHPTFPEE